MKIAIPTNDEKRTEVAEHFGRCLSYTFLNEKGEVLEIVKNTSEHEGGAGLPPELIKEKGADILLCRDLGPRALSLCKELGIKVYVFNAKTVKDIFKIWSENKDKEVGANDTCQDHKL